MTEDGATQQTDLLILNGAFQPDQVEIEVAGGSAVAMTRRDPGKETENEDTVAIIPFGPGAAVLVVADGAGGLPAGKRASLTAVTTLAASLQSSMERTVLLRTAILNGIEAANEAVLALANGSATTMTVITIEGLMARSYQIGDSEGLVVMRCITMIGTWSPIFWEPVTCALTWALASNYAPGTPFSWPAMV
jgi:serine/threonine protein phosphatase PrpC